MKHVEMKEWERLARRYDENEIGIVEMHAQKGFSTVRVNVDVDPY